MREGVSLCMEEGVGPLNPVQRKLLTDTQNNIDRLSRLVSDLLDISKIEEGKLRLRRSSVDLVALVQMVCEGYRSQANKKGIQLEKHLMEKPLFLYLDEDKVNQIFNNLIDNALRYTHAGGKITLSLKDQSDFVGCTVSDTGIGIAEENLPKLFSKFQQVGRVDGPGYKGTGLGLAICKGLVEKHGGKIEVQSIRGEGTIFHFTLKRIPFPKLLIVDDDENVIEIVKNLLADDHYRFIQAMDGEEAIEYARKDLPSLILLDMKLRTASGYEVIGRLKQDRRTQHLPILIMSAFPVDKERLNQLNENAVIPTITKPFEPVELRNKVRDMLGD
jgi:CheY-like chemotaxis protein